MFLPIPFLVDTLDRRLLSLEAKGNTPSIKPAVLFQDHVDNLNNAFDTAERELGIPKLLDAEDVDRDYPDERSIMTYVAEYYHKFAEMKKMGEFFVLELLFRSLDLLFGLLEIGIVALSNSPRDFDPLYIVHYYFYDFTARSGDITVHALTSTGPLLHLWFRCTFYIH